MAIAQLVNEAGGLASIATDIPVATKRYGLIELGDGNFYRVPRIGYGPLGDKLAAAIDAHRVSKTAADLLNTGRVLFEIALGAFYSSERINGLFNDGCIGPELLGALIDRLYGVESDAKAAPADEGEKKTSSGEQSPQLTTG